MTGPVYPSAPTAPAPETSTEPLCELADPTEVAFAVPPGDHGCRLDRVIARRIRRLSRTRIQELIAAGAVRDDAGRILARAGQRMRAGALVHLLRPPLVEPPVPRDYGVVHADDELFVIDKPAGIPVHPSARYHRNTLTALLRERLGADHPWVMAHRLDRETSGLLLFGRRGAPVGALKRAFQEQRVRKTYLAIVRGELRETLQIADPIGPARDSRIRIKMGIRGADDGGLPAVTRLRPRAWGRHGDDVVTLVEAHPQHGRQHQIRVHCAHAGYPVLGDKLYGIPEAWFLAVIEEGAPVHELEAQVGLARHALHAWRLEVPHPSDGRIVGFSAPWPEDLGAVLPLPGEPHGSSPPEPR
jgi:23S rRNA pseudouridine1911/1915/1917 synthase